LEETFQDVIKNYFQTFKNSDSSNKMSQLNIEDKRIKVVISLLNEENQEHAFYKSKEIICPKCNEPCLYKLENHLIKLYDCINNHITDNIKINDFPNTQIINTSNIICTICKEKNNEIYRCLICANNLCPSCKINHDSNHNIIKYEQKNYICHKHNDSFIKYCKDCKLNLCIMCEKEHKDHSTVNFGELVPDINKLKEKLSEFKFSIDIFNDKVKFIIKKLNEIIKTLNIYYKIQNDMIDNYNLKEKNYTLLQNLNEININNEIFEEIKNINEIQNIKNQIFHMIDLSDKINQVHQEIPNIEKNNDDIEGSSN